jgi:hypothetical protein
MFYQVLAFDNSNLVLRGHHGSDVTLSLHAHLGSGDAGEVYECAPLSEAPNGPLAPLREPFALKILKPLAMRLVQAGVLARYPVLRSGEALCAVDTSTRSNCFSVSGVSATDFICRS